MNLTIRKELDLILSVEELLTPEYDDQSTQKDFALIMALYLAAREKAKKIDEDFEFDALCFKYLLPELPKNKPDEWSYVGGEEV